MIKNLIQIGSVLSLLVVLSAVSAKAQTEFGSRAEIPFSFKINERSYEAGKYVVRVAKFQEGTALLNISDPKMDSIQVVLVRRRSDMGENDAQLVFENIDGQRVLSRIVTPKGGYVLHPTKTSKQQALNREKGRFEIVNISGVF